MEYSILDNLNDEQREPAKQVDGAVLVTAGAGSGKTRMLTHRIAYMVKELGINPNNILAITFTNKAANEMKERLQKMIDSLGDMWVCTFHAMCSKILRYNISLLGYTSSFSIYGDSETDRVIKRILESDKIKALFSNKKLEEEMNVKTLSWHISNAKNNLMSPDEYSKYIRDEKKCRIITEVYKDYEDTLFASNALDFDDLLTKTYELLTKHPTTLEFYQNKFKYIHVDEFQDTNTSQYELVKLLAAKHKNVFAVGDEDQCIYSWRGAQVANVKQYTIDFKECKIFKLEQNYRSTKKIIALANKVIKNNINRIEKHLWTSNEEGAEVQLKQNYNDIEESEQIAQEIKSLVTEQGYKYSDFAVLMRVNSLSRELEKHLLSYNVPYKIYGGQKFYERKEIKDTTAYLYLLANPNDNEAAIRMFSFPKKGIGDTSIEKIIEIAKENSVSIMDVINNAADFGVTGALANKLAPVRDLFVKLNAQKDNMPLEEFVEFVINEVGVKEAIGTKTEEDETRCLNIDGLLNDAKAFSDANEGAGVDEFLQSITLMRDIDSMTDEDDYVSLITVHAAKGLEFNVVFLMGLNDGLFPLSRAINSTNPNDLEEERRLMYVAITRAKKKLYLSRPKVKFNYETKSIGYTMTSRFLEEMFDDLKKKQNTNGVLQHSTLESSGFGETLSQSSRRESLDQRMSSHINIVNVAGTSTGTNNTSITKPQVSSSDYSKFKKGTRVKHNHFGEGVVTVGVTDFASAFVTIQFDKVGIKTLSLKYANLELID